MRLARNCLTLRPQLPCTSTGTISAESIRPSALLPRWPRGSRVSCGVGRGCGILLKKEKPLDTRASYGYILSHQSPRTVSRTARGLFLCTPMRIQLQTVATNHVPGAESIEVDITLRKNGIHAEIKQLDCSGRVISDTFNLDLGGVSWHYLKYGLGLAIERINQGVACEASSPPPLSEANSCSAENESGQISGLIQAVGSIEDSSCRQR